ncbi:MAG: MBL fold metallo-hydrolase [Candidatus Cloacimonetes bacterium]|nr:MBL fold metallo-hydrolase [Candidatus Cloacimonadota bacterium]
MFQTSILASGSKGNSIFVRTSATAVLLDAGLAGTAIFSALEKINVCPSGIGALLISHEHIDHIRGAGVISRKLHIPVYMTATTYFCSRARLGNLKNGIVHFEPGRSFSIGDLEITPFSSSHDVADACNFVFQKKDDQSRKLAVATDLGFGTKLLLDKIKNSTTIILESNHDLQMLLAGPYPWYLKQRIKGNQGHLSNEQAIGVISQVIHPGIRNLLLAHLSEVNNTPQLARTSMASFLNNIRHELNLVISSQYEPTALIDV